MKWYGAACISLGIEDSRLLFDPYFENHEIENNSGEFSNCAGICITHGHFDHIGLTAQLLKESSCPLYIPEGVEKNIIKWSTISSLNEEYKPFNFNSRNAPIPPDDVVTRIKTIFPGETIHINQHLKINPFLSNHVRYDPAIFREKLSKKDNWKYLRSAVKLARHYPQRTVLGYLMESRNKKIVNFGSLPERISTQIQSLAPIDILFIPMAGKKSHNLAAPAIRLIKALQPSVVVPHHHNDFFPPISDTTRTFFLKTRLEKDFPEIQFTEPEHGKETLINLKD